LDFW